MFLLDTNHCGYLIHGDPEVGAAVSMLRQDDVMTCWIVGGELLFMAENSTRKAENLAAIHKFLHEDIRVLDVDEQVATKYASLRAQIIDFYGPKERSKRRNFNPGVNENDCWIAAVALAHNLTVISSDGDFPRIQAACPSLNCDNWKSPS